TGECLDGDMTRQSSRAAPARRDAVIVLSAALIAIVVNVAIAADSEPCLFEPDVLRTDSALHQRTTGLADPLGRDCEPPAGGLSLAAAVDLALCRNTATRSAWAAAREQAAALGSAESAWLPSVTATGAESRYYGEHVDVTGALDSNPQNTRDAALSLSWTLYDFGARGGRIRGARHLLDAAAATTSSVAQQTVLNVVQSFYGVVASDASLGAAQSTEEASARSLEVARTLNSGGAGTLADVLQAETAYDQAVLARVQAESAAKIARGALSVTLGLPADQALKLDAQPVPQQVPPLTAHIGDLMQEAVRQRLDLAAAQAQRDAAEANVSVARATGLPSISITAGRQLIDTTGVPHQNYSLIGVNVTVPIFTGFSADYSVRQAKAALESSEVNVDQIRLNVSQGVWSAYYSLDSANQQIAVTAGLVRTAEQNNQVALGRYKAGVGTIVDVLTAQAAASLARQTRISAELGWEVARAQLAFALGRLSGTEPLTDRVSLP
ncbi:MAG: TolC family protein, partial [Steroidobacteraceae bacterium]